MARSTVFLVSELRERVNEARDLVDAAEGSTNFQYARRWYVYEAAFLLAFSAWENLLEQAFLRFLCGYSNANGVPPSNGNWAKPADVETAYLLVLGTKQFLLWHNPHYVADRSAGYFIGGPHETVLRSAIHDIHDFAAIRHYVAHRSHDTRVKFQLAVTRLVGAPTRGARAGRMLRAKTVDPVSNLQVSWFERILLDLERYGAQVAG